jgi:hypothetical protein
LQWFPAPSRLAGHDPESGLGSAASPAPRRRIAGIAAVALVLGAATACPAAEASVSRDRATKIALKALGGSPRSGPVIVYGSRRPLGPRDFVTDAGPNDAVRRSVQYVRTPRGVEVTATSGPAGSAAARGCSGPTSLPAGGSPTRAWSCSSTSGPGGSSGVRRTRGGR